MVLLPRRLNDWVNVSGNPPLFNDTPFNQPEKSRSTANLIEVVWKQQGQEIGLGFQNHLQKKQET